MSAPTPHPRISFILAPPGGEDFSQETIDSILNQTSPEWELLLPDDGSSPGASRTASAYAKSDPDRIRRIPLAPGPAHRPAQARNRAARSSRGDWLIFLDRDDLLLPDAVESCLTEIDAHPLAGLIFGSADRSCLPDEAPHHPAGADRLPPPIRRMRPNRLAFPPEPVRFFQADPSAAPCLGAVAIRSRLFESVGGFEEAFGAGFSELALYTRACLQAAAYVSGAPRLQPLRKPAVRRDRDDLESERSAFLDWQNRCLADLGVKAGEIPAQADRSAAALDPSAERDRLAELETSRAWLEAQWSTWKGIAEDRERQIRALKTWIEELETGKTWLEEDRLRWKKLAEDRGLGFAGLVRRAIGRIAPAPGPTQTEPAGREQVPPDSPAFAPPGAWPRRPVSQAWGFDRGLPIDRHYIERFLGAHAEDIRGAVLEIGDRAYTNRFGGEKVSHSDVLNIDPDDSQATIIADLTRADHIPSDRFDCIILTQTLHLIFDLPAAVKTVRRILKPGGVLLATFPGISRLSVSEWPDSWYWCLTRHSARRLFEAEFNPADLSVEAHGNVLAAAAFLYGFAAGELLPADLDDRDPEYDLLVTVRAVKDPQPARSPNPKGIEAAASRAARPDPAVCILLYHRIADSLSDPWDLCVSPQNFAEHLEVIREIGEPLSLETMEQELRAGRLPAPGIVLTFDDGYADNLTHALPILERQRIPAAVYPPAGMVGGGREYWWDELEYVLLEAEDLPETIDLQIGGKAYRRSLGQEHSLPRAEFVRRASWRTWMPAETARQEIYLELWQLLHPMLHAARAEVIEAILDWAQLPHPARDDRRIIGWDEAAALTAGGWFRIGSHGMTHSSLAALPPAEQAFELRESKRILETRVGREVTSLVYPYGKPADYSDLTVRMAAEAGYRTALINSRGLVRPGADPFRLPRFHVGNWPGEELARRLRAWMSEF